MATWLYCLPADTYWWRGHSNPLRQPHLCHNSIWRVPRFKKWAKVLQWILVFFFFQRPDSDERIENLSRQRPHKIRLFDIPITTAVAYCHKVFPTFLSSMMMMLLGPDWLVIEGITECVTEWGGRGVQLCWVSFINTPPTSQDAAAITIYSGTENNLILETHQSQKRKPRNETIKKAAASQTLSVPLKLQKSNMATKFCHRWVTRPKPSRLIQRPFFETKNFSRSKIWDRDWGFCFRSTFLRPTL